MFHVDLLEVLHSLRDSNHHNPSLIGSLVSLITGSSFFSGSSPTKDSLNCLSISPVHTINKTCQTQMIQLAADPSSKFLAIKDAIGTIWVYCIESLLTSETIIEENDVLLKLFKDMKNANFGWTRDSRLVISLPMHQLFLIYSVNDRRELMQDQLSTHFTLECIHVIKTPYNSYLVPLNLNYSAIVIAMQLHSSSNKSKCLKVRSWQTFLNESELQAICDTFPQESKESELSEDGRVIGTVHSSIVEAISHYREYIVNREDSAHYLQRIKTILGNYSQMEFDNTEQQLLAELHDIPTLAVLVKAIRLLDKYEVEGLMNEVKEVSFSTNFHEQAVRLLEIKIPEDIEVNVAKSQNQENLLLQELINEIKSRKALLTIYDRLSRVYHKFSNTSIISGNVSINSMKEEAAAWIKGAFYSSESQRGLFRPPEHLIQFTAFRCLHCQFNQGKSLKIPFLTMATFLNDQNKLSSNGAEMSRYELNYSQFAFYYFPAFDDDDDVSGQSITVSHEVVRGALQLFFGPLLSSDMEDLHEFVNVLKLYMPSAVEVSEMLAALVHVLGWQDLGVTIFEMLSGSLSTCMLQR